MKEIIDFIVGFVGDWGYFGIFVMMFLESSLFPFPSEVVMVPAGYLVYKNEMNALLAFCAGVGGSIMGALFNYCIAYKMGRAFILRYGKYVFFTPKALGKMESFFDKHGHISTFVGRLLPAVRQYISLPAGLCGMNLWKFCIFTGFGAGIWVGILMWIGYSLGSVFANLKQSDFLGGEALDWIKNEVHHWIFYLLGILLVLVCLYIFSKHNKHKEKQ